MSKEKGALFLLPNLLGKVKDHRDFLPQSVDQALKEIDGLIAESPQKGRSYLNRFQTKKPPYQITLAILNEHTPFSDLDFLLEPMESGETWGFVSDAGLPCIADPGDQLVQKAYKKNIKVSAFVGPSSIYLSLLLSGLPGQRFSFNGYLPRYPNEREKALKQLEKKSKQFKSSEIFIEAPYRNTHMHQAAIETLSPDTLFSVACNLTMPDQFVMTKKINEWDKNDVLLDKKPVVFILYASKA